MADGEEEYLLKPMTISHSTFSMTGATEDMLERFEMISLSPPTDLNDTSGYIEGDLWLQVLSYNGTDYRKDPQTGVIYVVVNKIWVQQIDDPYEDNYRETFVPQTALNYSGEKQVLSTPFLFYFGLRPGKTSLDLLIKTFGPSDAFVSEEIEECVISDVIAPTSSVPSYTPSVTPSISVSVTPYLSPSPTPTPSSIANVFGYTVTIFNCYNCNAPIASLDIQNDAPLDIGYYYKVGYDLVYRIDSDAIIGGSITSILGQPYSGCTYACSEMLD
jgi:hypothetical protein